MKDRAKVDLMNLAKEQQVILADYKKPVVAKKPRYYDIKGLKDRVIEPAELKFK